MDIQEVTDQIKALLGHPVVAVHTPDSTIEMNIRKAYKKYCTKILSEKTLAIPYSGGSRYDIKEIEPETVVVLNVTPELQSSAGYSEFNEFDVRTQMLYTGSYGSIQDYAYARQRNGNLQYLFDTFDFEYKEPYLYVDNIPYGVDELTVELLYKAPIEEVEGDWIEEYALALTKIVEGRIRSKFNGGPMEFESDGPTLVEEGNQEVRDLEEALKGKAPMYFSRRA